MSSCTMCISRGFQLVSAAKGCKGQDLQLPRAMKSWKVWTWSGAAGRADWHSKVTMRSQQHQDKPESLEEPRICPEP